MFSTSMA